jgi:drug/metabolite transporter (DMT)-like permease
MVFGFLCLALYAYIWGQGHRGPGLIWFMISGAIGVGLGDIATFLAIRRIGPRLSVMLEECLSAPIGAAVEWLWLGTKLAPFQLLGITVILVGSGLALWPEKEIKISPKLLRAGIALGTLGALGQALGAVITRKANEVNEAAHLNINGMTAAYQRMLGAFIIGILIFIAIEWMLRHQHRNVVVSSNRYKRAAPWTILNASVGLVLGNSCYQWALQYTSTGIVLAVVATTPLLVMPMAYWLDNDRPTRRAILGAFVAVAGVLILKFLG